MDNNEITLDISTLWRIFKKHAIFIIIVTVSATLIAFIISSFILTKKYSAEAKFYVENRQTQEIISVNDINTAKNIASTCIELFSTYMMASKLQEATGINYSASQLQSMISMNAINNSEFLRITVTMDDAQMAFNTLNLFADICITEFNDVIDSGKIKVIDPAILNTSPVYPNTNMFLAVGFIAGFLLSYLIVFVIDILDTKVKAEDDLFKIYDIPVFAEILNFNVSTKGEYGYEYK